MATISSAPPPPVLADRYRLERRLAIGGMAEVWLATDLQLSRHVAVKLLKPQLAADPVLAERFRREAISVAQLNHPNIVSVYDAIEADGRQAVVMQYVRGRSLRQLLDDEPRLSPDKVVRIGTEVAAALDAAHRAGLIHRDVKPGNILLTPDGRVLLTDFGIAKAAGDTDDLTSDNVMMGTAKYLSPEQVRGHRLDGRADLYSLGLVLYECLSGRVPFIGESDAATALARLQRDPTPLERLRPTLPKGLVDVINALLEREPNRRPSTGAETRTMLAGSLNPAGPGSAGAHPATDRESTPRSRRRPRPEVVLDEDRTPAPGPPPAPVDPTPTGGVPRRAQPSRQLQQRWGPPVILLMVLLAAAIVAAFVLWQSTVGKDDSRSTIVPTTIAVADTASSLDSPDTTTSGAGEGDIVVDGDDVLTSLKVRSYDPAGEDGLENEDEVQLATDGELSTAWQTVCYSNRYLGATGGVGLIVTLPRSETGTVDVQLSALPWNVELYAADSLPDSLEGWGQPVDQAFSTDERTATLSFAGDDASYLLVFLRELGRDPGCSEANPFRGGIAEIQVIAA